MAQFDFTQDAAHIHNWVRGMNPWPVAWFAQDGKRIKVLESRLAENPQQRSPRHRAGSEAADDCR